jgi:hypothetical protein
VEAARRDADSDKSQGSLLVFLPRRGIAKANIVETGRKAPSMLYANSLSMPTTYSKTLLE